jgi:hypothetical protein
MSLSTFNESWDDKVNGAATTVIVRSALALCNALELFILISTGFKRWHGLYFWSLLVSSAGDFLYGIGFLLEYVKAVKGYAGDIINKLGLDYDGHRAICGSIFQASPGAL